MWIFDGEWMREERKEKGGDVGFFYIESLVRYIIIMVIIYLFGLFWRKAGGKGEGKAGSQHEIFTDGRSAVALFWGFNRNFSFFGKWK